MNSMDRFGDLNNFLSLDITSPNHEESIENIDKFKLERATCGQLTFFITCALLVAHLHYVLIGFSLISFTFAHIQEHIGLLLSILATIFYLIYMYIKKNEITKELTTYEFSPESLTIKSNVFLATMLLFILSDSPLGIALSSIGFILAFSLRNGSKEREESLIWAINGFHVQSKGQSKRLGIEIGKRYYPCRFINKITFGCKIMHEDRQITKHKQDWTKRLNKKEKTEFNLKRIILGVIKHRS